MDYHGFFINVNTQSHWPHRLRQSHALIDSAAEIIIQENLFYTTAHFLDRISSHGIFTIFDGL